MRRPILYLCLLVISSVDCLLSKEEVDHLVDIAHAVRRVKRNPFKREDPRDSDTDLREKEKAEDVSEEDDVKFSDDKRKVFEGDKSEYCDRFEQHFSFYCVGDVDRSGKYDDVTSKFCPAYKKACPGKTITNSVPQTSWPEDPFSKKIVVSSPRRPAQPKLKEESIDSDDYDEEEDEEIYITELRRRYPCKPDCDIRIFPHCTEECKCDYLYPTVQKFCNPPPLPLFLNTCRLWYNGCPKYERYHYASQFVYSKAEKGKKLPGPNIRPVNPYNIPSPGSSLAPIRVKRLAEENETVLFEPPPLPVTPRKDSVVSNSSPAPSLITEDARGVLSKYMRTKKRVRRRLRSKKQVKTSPKQMTPRELYMKLSAINSITKDGLKWTKDPASLRGAGPIADALASTESPVDGISEEKLAPLRQKLSGNGKARAYQGNVPVVPSESAAADDTFRAFDGLSDSHGIVHRPHSTSPFSKPGLWEPNPVDPHSRDPTNKYFYHPESVNVDWLNGQLNWGAHWAVPAAGTGGTQGYSAVHFPTIGTFLNIPDDYD